MSEKKENPKEEIAKTNLLNKRNLYRLLAFLRDVYPIGYSLKGIRRELDLETLSERQLDDLRSQGLVVKRNLEVAEGFKEMINPNFLKYFPEYVITQNGMNFVNSLDTHKLTINMHQLALNMDWLTKVITVATFAQLFLTLIELMINIGVN